MPQFAIVTGTITAGLSVAIGAFGAHAWKIHLQAIHRLETFETAAQYQMYGGLVLILLGVWQLHLPSPLLKKASYFHLVGSIIFPGSLYLICLTGNTIWGAVAPLGGLSFILGFSMMAIQALKKS